MDLPIELPCKALYADPCTHSVSVASPPLLQKQSGPLEDKAAHGLFLAVVWTAASGKGMKREKEGGEQEAVHFLKKPTLI